MAKTNRAFKSSSQPVRRRKRHILWLSAAAAAGFIAVLLCAGREDAGENGVLQRVGHAAAQGMWFARGLAGAPMDARRTASGVPQVPHARAAYAENETANPFSPAPSVGRGESAGARDGGGVASGSASGPPAAAGENSSAGSQASAQQTTSGQFAGFGPGPAPAGLTAQQAQNQLTKVARGLSTGTQGGVLVDQVLASSIAGKLGLQQGDLIVAVNGQPINSPAEFAQVYEQEGTPRQIDAVRNGHPIHLHP